MWKSDDNLHGSVPTFRHMGPGLGDQTQVVKVGSNHLYSLSHLASPLFTYMTSWHSSFFFFKLEASLKFFNVHFYFMCVNVLLGMCVHGPYLCLVPVEVRRRHWLPWHWNCRQL